MSNILFDMTVPHKKWCGSTYTLSLPLGNSGFMNHRPLYNGGAYSHLDSQPSLPGNWVICCSDVCRSAFKFGTKSSFPGFCLNHTFSECKTVSSDELWTVKSNIGLLQIRLFREQKENAIRSGETNIFCLALLTACGELLLMLSATAVSHYALDVSAIGSC